MAFLSQPLIFKVFLLAHPSCFGYLVLTLLCQLFESLFIFELLLFEPIELGIFVSDASQLLFLFMLLAVFVNFELSISLFSFVI